MSDYSSFQTTVVDDDDVEYEVSGVYITDADYGADGDGNRGVHRSWWEDISIMSFDGTVVDESTYERLYESAELALDDVVDYDDDDSEDADW